MLDQLFNMFCETYGHQLETIELGRHVRFLMADNIMASLKACPGLKELNFHIFFTFAPKCDDGYEHSGIETIGLHPAVNSMMLNGLMLFDLLNQHFAFLASGALPNLRRIVLHGEWRFILEHPMFAPVGQSLKQPNARYRVCTPDGQPHPYL